MRLLFIRHGETPWTVAKKYQGSSDIPLGPRGIRQAKRIGETLRAFHPTRLYTSTLRRAKQTGQEIAVRLKLRPIRDRRLNELDFGEWEGADYRRLSKEAGPKFQRWQGGKLQRPPGGESMASLSRRVGEFLKEILDRHADETVAIVSHGGPIKVFLFKVLKLDGAPIGSFRIDPGSLSLVEGDSRLLQIVWTNRTNHLRSLK